MMRLLCILCCFIFASKLTANSCDTLFIASKVNTHYTGSLKGLQIDSSYDSGYFHDSITAVFSSKRKDLSDKSIIAVRWRKGWKYWKIYHEATMTEFGDIQFSHADITGDGEPELFLWVFDYFSHHSAMESDERKDYAVLVFDVAHSKELLDFNFRSYNSDLMVDMGGLTDSLGNPWPPDVDEYFPLYFYTGKLFVYDSSKVRAPVFLNEAAADSASRIRYIGVYTIDDCADHSGVYILRNDRWIRTNDTSVPAEQPVCAPHYDTWWEVPFWNVAPDDH